MIHHQNGTVFQTKEGEVIYTSLSRWSTPAANRALKQAKRKGAKSLIAIEADGRELDYSLMLTNTNGAT